MRSLSFSGPYQVTPTAAQSSAVQASEREHNAPGQCLRRSACFRSLAGRIAAARELAEAERAVAQHTAPPDVMARIDALRTVREPEERVQRWRASHA